MEIPNVNMLTPEMNDKEIAAVRVVGGEQPGMGKALGAVTGGAIGLAGGAALVPAIASSLVPGIGPVLGIGIFAGTLLGAIGAVGGEAAGAALEGTLEEGLPEDELFVYEDALRKGRSVLVVRTEDDEANAVRGAFELAGAESVDRAREMWWLGLRDIQKEQYSTEGSDFDHDEPDFRKGFEAALRLRNRNCSYEEYCQRLSGRDTDSGYERKGFRNGYERGQQYLEAFRKHGGRLAS
jgi:hypothetical protein